MAQGRCHLLKKAAQVLAHTLTLGHTHTHPRTVLQVHTHSHIRAFSGGSSKQKKTTKLTLENCYLSLKKTGLHKIKNHDKT